MRQWAVEILNSFNAISRLMIGLMCCALLQQSSGCLWKQAGKGARLPDNYTVRGDQLRVHSNKKLSANHELMLDLKALRQQVSEVLEIPLQEREVVVYLFTDEAEYQGYLQTMYPGLPNRRAYFIGTSSELAVYTYWGERIQEDLRHEFTHGLLHASIKEIPLWLDEALAEYFEVQGPVPGGVNRDSVQSLLTALENDWSPNLGRLETLTQVHQMQQLDYQESWAWIHMLMHESTVSKAILLEYIHELRRGKTPGSFEEHLAGRMPDYRLRLVAHLAKSLHQTEL